MTAYSAATPCTNNDFKLTGNSTNSITLNGGVYFISGQLTLTGGVSISGTALFILLPGASLTGEWREFHQHQCQPVGGSLAASARTSVLRQPVRQYGDL